MLLAIDIGNTNITLGIFEKEKLIKVFRLLSDINLSFESILKEQLQSYTIEGCIISSVVKELDKIIKTAVDKLYNINSMILNTKMHLGINLKIQNPERVGSDRIANAVGAKKYKLPVIVIDTGTATTFDILDKNGNFIGGIIMPGIKLQLKSLNTNTSELPDINIENFEKIIGNNTKNAILSGVIGGHASAIEGLIIKCEKELREKATIVGTGGFSEIVSNYMNTGFDFIDKNLTLEGLKFLYKLNS